MSSNPHDDLHHAAPGSRRGANPSEDLPAALDLASRARTHLLIVEDEPTIRQLFAALLSAAGFSVAEAVDGFDALEEVRRKRPALILSDLNMPRMTGFELLSIIRRRFPSIRVIAMSGAFSGDSVPEGVSADAFYEKSGRHINTLVDVIEDILGNPAVDGKRVEPAFQPQQPVHYPSVALWVTRRGNPIEGTYILLTCQECLRSFPFHPEADRTMQVRHTPCVFCSAPIAYALLDPSITHHPGYAPSKSR
jgi:CheY-like chemotaxis protein